MHIKNALGEGLTLARVLEGCTTPGGTRRANREKYDSGGDSSTLQYFGNVRITAAAMQILARALNQKLRDNYRGVAPAECNNRQRVRKRAGVPGTVVCK
jgi:hypothetical protein